MSHLCQVTENVEWVEGCVHLLGEAVADEEIQSPKMIPRGFFQLLWVIEVSFLSWLESWWRYSEVGLTIVETRAFCVPV